MCMSRVHYALVREASVAVLAICVYLALACLMQSAASVCAMHMQRLLSSLASCVRLCGILGLRCRLLSELRTLACK